MFKVVHAVIHMHRNVNLAALCTDGIVSAECTLGTVDDIDFRRLKLHLQMLPDAVKATLLDGIYVRKITRVQTICKIALDRYSFDQTLL